MLTDRHLVLVDLAARGGHTRRLDCAVLGREIDDRAVAARRHPLHLDERARGPRGVRRHRKRPELALGARELLERDLADGLVELARA